MQAAGGFALHPGGPCVIITRFVIEGVGEAGGMAGICWWGAVRDGWLLIVVPGPPLFVFSTES